jgi:tetratricopeptide (TPR) repeat protein
MTSRRIEAVLALSALLAVALPLRAEEAATPAAPAPASSAPSATDAAAPPAGDPAAPPAEAAPPPPPPPVPGGVERVPDSDRVRTRLLSAWGLRARNLEERAAQVARQSFALGLRSLDAPARALLLDPKLGGEIERLNAAARLAPQLPAAHAERARALWSGGRPREAIASLLQAWRAAQENLEAWLWVRSELAALAVTAAFAAALLYCALAAAAALPRVMRQLRALRADLPSASRLAWVLCLALLPAALGEGVAGGVLGLAAVALLGGSLLRRALVVASLALLVLAIHPLVGHLAMARAALAGDPLVFAAVTSEAGLPSVAETAWLLREAERRPLAARAAAVHEKRTGRLDEAARLIEPLVSPQATPDLLNNAANVRLARRDLDGAIALYEQAARAGASPVVLFNLAQAYGKAVRLDEQDLALAEAQAIDPAEISRLTQSFVQEAPGSTVDLALPNPDAARALLDPADAKALAARMRAVLAPGWFGRGVSQAAALAGVVAALALTIGLALGRAAGPDADHYSDIARILQSRGGDPAVRMARIASLRARQARLERLGRVAAWIVPGAAGMLRARPLLAWLGSTSFAVALAIVAHGASRIPDPLAAGATLAGLAPLALAALGVVYVASLALTFALGERS